METSGQKYDFLIVGAGLYGATFARIATDCGKKCLVIDKRSHIAGNCYTENVGGINVHKYGAHIFHTDYKEVWEFVNHFAEFNRYINSPVANFRGEIYSLPFNMYTFNQMWGVKTPAEASKMISEQRENAGISNPSNLEEQAISLVGSDIYTKLVKGYTEKQWGRSAKDLSPDIIKRLPVRYTYDNNYYNDRYQGIPMGGYTSMIEKMLSGIEVRLNEDFLSHREYYKSLAERIIYTGTIDGFFDYKFGKLDYRSLKFETKYLPEEDNFQGNAVVNYTDGETSYTRIIEHKHFEFNTCSGTVITYEYPLEKGENDEPYYPISDSKNASLYEKYKDLGKTEEKVFFGGRLGKYKYFDMDDVIYEAMKDTKELITDSGLIITSI